MKNNVMDINFPNNIRRMESDAFFETGISTPLYNDYIYAYMPPSLLVSSVSIPEGIQEIARTAFYKCSELQSVEIPNSVTIIGGGAFKCSGVKYVSIGKNVSSIGTEVFYGCNHLEEIYNYATTPQNIVAPVFGGSDSYPAVDKTKCKLYVPEASVEAYKAKDVWKEFTNIIGFIPDIVKIGDLYYSLNDENHTAWVTYETLAYEDGELKYENYKGLKNVTVPSEVTYANEQYTVISIGMAAFAGSNIESIDIPASVEAIGPSAISDCFALKTVTLHEGLKTIYSQAFAGCIQLESIDIPAGVEEIRDGAFAVCPALKSVTIPESVTRIGEWVFYCCSSLAQITNYATTPQYIVASVFGGNDEYPAVDKTKCKLYVPEASVEAYKAANVWKDFGDNIIGIKDPQGIESIQPSAISHQKVIRDGLLLIEKNGKTYNAQGVEIK